MFNSNVSYLVPDNLHARQSIVVEEVAQRRCDLRFHLRRNRTGGIGGIVILWFILQNSVRNISRITAPRLACVEMA